MTSVASSRFVTSATSATARANAASFAFDGFVVPLTLRTYWSAAALTSSRVAGGSKLWSVLMFLHMHPSLATVDAPSGRRLELEVPTRLLEARLANRLRRPDDEPAGVARHPPVGRDEA